MDASRQMRVWALDGIPEIVAGDDLAEIIGDALEVTAPGGTPLEDGDVLVVTSKIVSKAEGRMIRAADREDAITAETVRVVASREHPGGVTRIVENRLGIVAAAAGVDSSNTPEGTVLLLPVDPDASARALAVDLRARFGVRIGVVVSDTLGRPWREGQTDVAIGAAGIRVIDDLRGTTDAGGRPLNVTVPAVADEIAAATDLVKGKSASLPVAVVRGLRHLVGDLDLPGARSIVRPAEQDMFRLGAAEAHAEGYDEGYAAGYAEGAAEVGDNSEAESSTP
jgi:coenzyme F420-0:L-glutamate ligase/coenzyme F420-1:gamma-L-glutamate ligase